MSVQRLSAVIQRMQMEMRWIDEDGDYVDEAGHRDPDVVWLAREDLAERLEKMERWVKEARELIKELIDNRKKGEPDHG